MKNTNPLFLLLIFAIVTLLSCEKEDNGNGSNDGPVLSMESISAKWSVEGTGEYESFEFNESGNYIVVKNATSKKSDHQIVLFGTYTITEDSRLVLSDFGTIEVMDITENSISFSITLIDDPDNEVIITASRQMVVESSNRTDLLCRAWELITINDEPVEGTPRELTVLFSPASTYFVSLASSEDESDGGLAQWRWKDAEEQFLLYSWDDVPNWSSANEVEILELTEEVLRIYEQLRSGDEEIFYMIPYSGKKSENITDDDQNSAHSGSARGWLNR